MLEDPGCCQPDLPNWKGRSSELFLESKNQECSTEEKKGRRCKTVHSYYQWVAYILVFQVSFQTYGDDNDDYDKEDVGCYIVRFPDPV